MTRLQRGIEKANEIISNKDLEVRSECAKNTSTGAVKAKRTMSREFQLVDGTNFSRSISGTKFFVTKKLDGIFIYGNIYSYDKRVFTTFCTSSGEELKGLKCFEEFTEYAQKYYQKVNNGKIEPQNIQLSIFMELYMPGEKRTRVADVLHALACDEKHKLALAPFFYEDSSVTGKSIKTAAYDEKITFLADLFTGAKQISPVPLKTVELSENEPVEQFKQRVSDIYNEWVVKEGAEGLVVRNENGIIWKIKPRHTIDAAAIGFAIDVDGTLRDLMFAVLDQNGRYHRFACGATGLSNIQKEEFLEYFKTKVVPSKNFYYANSVGIPYQMVVPEKVFEISCVDLASRKGDDKTCTNDLLVFSTETGWSTKGLVNGASCHGLSVVREREDKSCIYEDIRIEQLSQIAPFAKEENFVDFESLPESTVVDRAVYVKQRGKCYFAKKFLIWKTNKEQTKMYPPYILYFEDFSTRRKEHIKYDLFTAQTFEDAKTQRDELISKKVPEGWNYVY